MFRRNLMTQLALPAVGTALIGIVVLVHHAGSEVRQRIVEQLVEDGVSRLGEYRELRTH